MEPLHAGEALVRNHVGQRLVINRTTRSAFRRHGRFDWLGLEVMERALSRIQAAVAIDIGANIGNHSLVFAHHCRQVYAFEPQLRSGIRLRDNIEMNELGNIRLMDVALSNSEGVERLYISPLGNGGGSSLVASFAHPGARSVEIPVRIGDAVLAEQGIERVDLLKIDVEGFEANVIAGLERMIARERPLVFLEWNNDETRLRFRQLAILERVFGGWDAHAIVNSHGRSEFGRDLPGKLSRAITRCTTRRHAVLRPFEPALSYENVVFFHPAKRALILP